MSKKLKMFIDTRAEAIARGDRKLAHTMDVEIARLGFRVPTVHETTQVTTTMEQAIPDKPRKGRPPKPRCEHEMLLDRCPECSIEGI